MDNTKTKPEGISGFSDFSIKDYIQACKSRWQWILLSLIICVGAGVLYILCQQPEYQRTEEVLIKDQEGGSGVPDMAGVFSSFGLVSSNTSVYNELISLKSPAVMYEVARRLHLDMNYDRLGGFHPVTLYGHTLPYIVDMQGIEEQGGASFKMELSADGNIKMREFRKFTIDGKIELAGEATLPKGKESVKTPIGIVKVTPNPEYDGLPITESIELKVVKKPMQTTVENYGEKLNGDLVNQDAEIIGLTIRDVSVQRAEDILNKVLLVYNENWIEDKNKMAVATSAFIDERLRLIQQELGDVDSNIAKYQTTTGSPDLIASAQASMEKESNLEQSILNIENQLSITTYMKDFLDDSANKFNIIPANTGLDNPSIEKDIATYNTILLARNNLVSNSSERNPLVEDYDSQLNGLRESITRSMSNRIAGLKTRLRSFREEKIKTTGKIAGTSEKALPLLSDTRQQKVKEGLYLFLLQKREENELSQKFTAENTRVITPPMGSLKPVSPKKKLILAVTFLLGLALPLITIYMLETGNTKVRSKKDLDGVKIPFAGEIPFVGKRKKFKVVVKKNKKLEDEKPPLAVVEEGKRDVVNEAFRVIRSNIDFMSGKGDGSQIIMLTSFNPGSGKSFISYNLGLSFALKKKRVLLIDCDLRHGSSSMFVGMPHKGITDYLTGNNDNWRSLIVKVQDNELLSILPVGKMPPNPAELLENGRLTDLLNEVRGEYDYVLLDCPPVNIVVDTQIVGQYADRTLFVVRAGLLEREALTELNEFYENKKFKNMSLILNGTEAVHSRYYTYGNYQSYQ